jgi:hypothetical protein
MPLPSSIALGFASLDVLKYWNVHRGFNISTIRTQSCCWVLGPDLSSSATSQDQSPVDIVCTRRM